MLFLGRSKMGWRKQNEIKKHFNCCRRYRKIKAVLPKKEDVVKNVVAGGVVITLMALMFTGGVGTVISLAAFGGIVITSNLM